MKSDAKTVLETLVAGISRPAKKDRGYHDVLIPKSDPGTAMKVVEEAIELVDADLGGCRVMALLELSDIVLAMSLYLEREFGDSVTMEDLVRMAGLTRRSFESGER